MSAVVDFPVRPEARPYIEAFDRRAGVAEPEWLARDRRRGRKSESWRYLDLQPLETRPLLPTEAPAGRDSATLRQRLAELSLAGPGSRLVLVDGRFAPELSTVAPVAGIWFGAMSRPCTRTPPETSCES